MTFAALLLTVAPLLVVNEDNDHYFKVHEPTREALESYVDKIAASGRVTHIAFCTCGQRASYGSKVWEPIWAALDEGFTNRWILCAKALYDKGIDPYAVWIARCRARGISPWVSMRMNDGHFAREPRHFRTTTFFRRNRQLMRRPEVLGHKKTDNHDYVFDFAHPEVRDYTFRMAEEQLVRFAADGLELDFTRCHYYFRLGHERDDAHYLTDLVRRIRTVARANGRKIAVRVPDTLLSCEELGLEVVRWAEEDLVDVVVPSSKYWIMPFGLPLGEWTQKIAAVNSKVIVIPATDKHIATEEYCGNEADEASFRGWAANMYGAGAKGLYLFNAIYTPQTNKRDPDLFYRLCGGILDRENLQTGELRFLRSARSFPPHDPVFTRLFSGPHVVELPRDLGAVKSGEVILGTMESEDFDASVCAVFLNGVRATGPARAVASDDPRYHGRGKQILRWTFPATAFRPGENVITVGGVTETSRPPVTWCEIALTR